jgi:hypothetical protein
MPSIAASITAGGIASVASGNRRRSRVRVAASVDSGNCTPTTPRSLQAMPRRLDRRIEERCTELARRRVVQRRHHVPSAESMMSASTSGATGLIR